MATIDWGKFPSPCYVIDEDKLVANLDLLARLRNDAGCKVLLALKGFATHAVFHTVRHRLSGATASSLFEARLAREELGKETHIFMPAYRDDEFEDILKLCDHVVFNSFAQWDKFRCRMLAEKGKVSAGIRVNPGLSEIATPLYDPCREGSRLGVTRENFRPEMLDGVEGLHFHALCEQGADTLERVAAEFEKRFGEFIPRMKWINLGGGHLITRPGYDVAKLADILKGLRARYGVETYIEPGEAVALDAGWLVSTVLDVVENGGVRNAILDTSATCHMPDVLEMPYRPAVLGAGAPGEKPWTYRLGGMTCLAGDVIGDWSFDRALAPGDKVVFADMAHYTMVKNHMFNGVNLPAIALWSAAKGARVVRRFGYRDYRERLS
jgi:carboxynorspermidine decarboxylase